MSTQPEKDVPPPLLVEVRVYSSPLSLGKGEQPIVSYAMDHNDEAQRRRLGQECRRAFEAGQVVLTWGVP